MKFVNGRVVRPLSHGEFSGASEVTQFDVMDVDIDVFPEEYARPDEGVVIEDVAGFPAQEGVPSPTLVDEVEDSPSLVDVSPEGSSETSIPDDANVSSGDSPLGDSGQIHDSAAPNVSAEYHSSRVILLLFFSTAQGASFIHSSQFSLEPDHYHRHALQFRDGSEHKRGDRSW